MKKIIKNSIREIIIKEYNQINIDSFEYLEFENILIQNIMDDGYVEEGFNNEIIKKRVYSIFNEMRNKNTTN